MTDEQLQEIEARVNVLPDEYWEFDEEEIGGTNHGDYYGLIKYRAEVKGLPTAELRRDYSRAPLNVEVRLYDKYAKEKALFIAHARTDIPALIAEVRRLREDLAAASSKDTDAHFPC